VIDGEQDAVLASNFAEAREGENAPSGSLVANARAKQGDWKLVGLFHRSAVAQIACGVFHTMFLLQSSEVFAVGRGDWGLLGMGDRMDRKLPSKITELQVLSCTPNHEPLNL
jgi:alpha-tubulin suppressor-like RCC1 family protein